MQLLLMLTYTLYACGERSFKVDFDNNVFLKDGKPFRYISGSIHYMRVPEYYWEDRLFKMRKAGLNAIQTYVPWNSHEPFEGQFDFTGQKNVFHFLELAQKHDLLVLFRAGPYICGEWEFGGFPYWLLKNNSINLRTSDPTYLKAVDKWLSVLLKRLSPYLYANGGPVIMVQLENEYGIYGCDHQYMNELEVIFRKHLGESVILYTTDHVSSVLQLKCGSLDSLFSTVDFGSVDNPENVFHILRQFQSSGPLVNSEYYTGWLDHWGKKHHRVSTSVLVKVLDKVLAMNSSVNFYMFEGGTNFGFMNGANSFPFSPQPTSYDYDAPLSEAGDPTLKYFAIQELISKYLDIPPGPQPKPSPKAAYGKIYANNDTSLYSLLPSVSYVNNSFPLSFEELDVPYGYVMYRTICPTNATSLLNVTKLHDRAQVMVDKVFKGILDRNINTSISLECVEGNLLDIFVENQGRINSGVGMKDSSKGILDKVLFGGKVLRGWQMFFLGEKTLKEVKQLHSHDRVNVHNTRPTFYLFNFHIQEALDTFLKFSKWTKGVIVLNNFMLGRYWNIGPQKTLFVPGSVLRKSNSLMLFETDQTLPLKEAYVEFVDTPILG